MKHPFSACGIRWGRLILSVVALLAVQMATPTLARDAVFSRTVPSGKSARIESYGGWNADCSHKELDVTIVHKPLSGTVTPRFETRKITSALSGDVGKCRGRAIRALALFYKSNAGFRGKDRFTVRISAPNVPSATVTFNIAVR